MAEIQGLPIGSPFCLSNVKFYLIVFFGCITAFSCKYVVHRVSARSCDKTGHEDDKVKKG